MAKLTTNRGFWKNFLLSLITLGFYRWYLIHAFAKETNLACQGDGRNTPGLLVYVLLSIVTLGIYAIVWRAKWINRCNIYLIQNGKPQGVQSSTYVLTVFFGVFTLFILNLVVFCKILYLQNAVNRTYNEKNESAEDTLHSVSAE